ncbi:hypothetical protein V494_02532 [Pseudogymnoascus sp. VKM F-4513 (FW-928)]|nr:hypothetical protein V494_02532 [Pseudogymnoascus sp. VKM F-4513 (FW-928)]
MMMDRLWVRMVMDFWVRMAWCWEEGAVEGVVIALLEREDGNGVDEMWEERKDEYPELDITLYHPTIGHGGIFADYLDLGVRAVIHRDIRAYLEKREDGNDEFAEEGLESAVSNLEIAGLCDDYDADDDGGDAYDDDDWVGFTDNDASGEEASDDESITTAANYAALGEEVPDDKGAAEYSATEDSDDGGVPVNVEESDDGGVPVKVEESDELVEIQNIKDIKEEINGTENSTTGMGETASIDWDAVVNEIEAAIAEVGEAYEQDGTENSTTAIREAISDLHLTGSVDAYAFGNEVDDTKTQQDIKQEDANTCEYIKKEQDGTDTATHAIRNAISNLHLTESSQQEFADVQVADPTLEAYTASCNEPSTVGDDTLIGDEAAPSNNLPIRTRTNVRNIPESHAELKAPVAGTPLNETVAAGDEFETFEEFYHDFCDKHENAPHPPRYRRGGGKLQPAGPYGHYKEVNGVSRFIPVEESDIDDLTICGEFVEGYVAAGAVPGFWNGPIWEGVDIDMMSAVSVAIHYHLNKNKFPAQGNNAGSNSASGFQGQTTGLNSTPGFQARPAGYNPAPVFGNHTAGHNSSPIFQPVNYSAPITTPVFQAESSPSIPAFSTPDLFKDTRCSAAKRTNKLCAIHDAVPAPALRAVSSPYPRATSVYDPHNNTFPRQTPMFITLTPAIMRAKEAEKAEREKQRSNGYLTVPKTRTAGPLIKTEENDGVMLTTEGDRRFSDSVVERKRGRESRYVDSDEELDLERPRKISG